MKTLIEEYPNLRKKLKKIIESPEAMYMYDKTESLVSMFTKALKLDHEIDPDDIAIIVTTIPVWLEYLMIVDYFTDAERSEFEKTVLKDYHLIVAQLNKNRLRVSQLRMIDTFLQMNDSLFVNKHTKELWEKHMQIARQNKEVCIEGQPVLKSIYEVEYETEARINYITKTTVIVNAICREYIDSKISK